MKKHFMIASIALAIAGCNQPVSTNSEQEVAAPNTSPEPVKTAQEIQIERREKATYGEALECAATGEFVSFLATQTTVSNSNIEITKESAVEIFAKATLDAQLKGARESKTALDVNQDISRMGLTLTNADSDTVFQITREKFTKCYEMYIS